MRKSKLKKVFFEIIDLMKTDYNLTFYDVMLYAYDNDKDVWVSAFEDGDNTRQKIAKVIDMCRPVGFKINWKGKPTKRQFKKIVEEAAIDYHNRVSERLREKYAC